MSFFDAINRMMRQRYQPIQHLHRSDLDRLEKIFQYGKQLQRACLLVTHLVHRRQAMVDRLLAIFKAISTASLPELTQRHAPAQSSGPRISSTRILEAVDLYRVGFISAAKPKLSLASLMAEAMRGCHSPPLQLMAPLMRSNAFEPSAKWMKF